MSETISWKRYDDKYKLSEVLTDAARACVDANTEHPKDYLVAYFLKVTRGDTVEVLSCDSILNPNSEMGLKLHLRLFNNVEAHTVTLRLSGLERAGDAPEGFPAAAGDLAGGTRSAHSASHGPHAEQRAAVLALLAQLREDLLPQLQQFGCYAQDEWDSTIANYRSTSSKLLPCLSFAFSLVAAIAAAKSLRLTLYQHFRNLYLANLSKIPGGDYVSGSHATSVTPFFMPQLVIPFWGSPVDRPAPTGSMFVHSLYLLPGVSATSAADVKRSRTLPAELLGKIADAYHILAKRIPGGASGAGSTQVARADGAIAWDGPVESIVHAITFTSDVLRQVGLEPGRDVCFGMRIQCPITRHSATEDCNSTVTSTGTKARLHSVKAVAGAGKKAARRNSTIHDVMYALFQGDADISGAQMAVYLKQQVEAVGGVLVFIEDSHEADDQESMYRLQCMLKQQLNWGGILSGYGLYNPHGEEEGCERRVLAGTQLAWSHSVALCPDSVGFLTELFKLQRIVHQSGRASSVVLAPHVHPAEAVVDLAIGTGASFLNVGGLQLTTACAAVSRYMSLQDAMLAKHSVGEPPLWEGFYPKTLPSVPEDTPIPEIKRKGDKKKVAK